MTLSTLKTLDQTSNDPNIRQRQATIPEHDVWVAASAGSGKTKVLTDRVLRLLLPDPQGRWTGSAPHKILCITFTKAAAALMALRIQKKLGEWAMMPEDKLVESLTELLGIAPNAEIIKSARQLFSDVLDVPGGLSVMTIHAFCQSTLGRFAIEAGVTPGFTVLEDGRAQDLLRRIVDDMIIGVEENRIPAMKSSFQKIATYMDLESLRDTLLGMMSKSREIKAFLASLKPDETIQSRLLACLDYQPDQLPVWQDDATLKRMAQILCQNGGKRSTDIGVPLAEWLAIPAEGRLARLDILSSALLTAKDKPRQITKKILDPYPEFADTQQQMISELTLYQDQQARLQQASQTAELLSVVAYCLKQYERRKQELNALDFQDLILKTRSLLENENVEWVHYKLDEGIDHLLVDEAQDTNPHQWEIIRKLTDEFLSGQGNDQRLRSLFVVGDEKQSIFSFHGADPEAFDSMRSYFARRSAEADRHFDPVRLETSFRSTPPVLKLVDQVFERVDLRKRLGLPADQPLIHYSFREQDSGLVELWPIFQSEKRNTRNIDINWNLPPVSTDSGEEITKTATSSPMAAWIAMTIAGWLAQGEKLVAEDRPIEPRDILVLVRTRTRLVPDLVRQLKIRGVPVSGADRMKLGTQIAVMDCLALARFARFPEDDLSLACVLRSPFIRLSEDELMNLALGRTGSLWAEVQKKCSPAIVAWCRLALTRARTEKPFDFFDDLLNSICPFDGASSGWRAFSTCLGSDCLDPLDEFLSYCLSKEDDGVFSLEELIAVMQASTTEIKRDNDEGDKEAVNQVRIMTVHASKGLEAPIVFLPDTTSIPNRKKIDTLLWAEDGHRTGNASTGTGAAPHLTPLWTAKPDDSCQAYQDLRDQAYERMISEHMRLLYVALTRPRDRLYIMGETNSKTLKDECWYKLVEEAFAHLPCEKDPNGILRWTSTQQKEVKAKADTGKDRSAPPALPDWIKQSVADDEMPLPRVIQPSRLADETENKDQSLSRLARSPRDMASANRFQRGVLTHKLFQILPELPLAHRQDAAEKFLMRTGKSLSVEIRQDIIRETMAILTDPVFADVFGPNAQAEVPVAGDLGDGRRISGQIDRLVIDINKILIVDFKTNRPSPRTENDIPASYRNQLKAYKTALLRIFPDREIHCALLWTDQPLLMPVSV